MVGVCGRVATQRQLRAHPLGVRFGIMAESLWHCRLSATLAHPMARSFRCLNSGVAQGPPRPTWRRSTQEYLKDTSGRGATIPPEPNDQQGRPPPVVTVWRELS
jgi:hypothetical protein